MQQWWRSLFVCSIALLTSCATSPPREAAEPSIRSALPGRWDWDDASPRCGDSAAQFAFSEVGPAGPRACPGRCVSRYYATGA